MNAIWVKSVDKLARMLHQFYLESIKKIPNEFYNPEADLPFDELTKEQQFIDRYIAEQLLMKISFSFNIADLSFNVKFKRET